MHVDWVHFNVHGALFPVMGSFLRALVLITSKGFVAQGSFAHGDCCSGGLGRDVRGNVLLWPGVQCIAFGARDLLQWVLFCYVV